MPQSDAMSLNPDSVVDTFLQIAEVKKAEIDL
jgi:hypothetical protein